MSEIDQKMEIAYENAISRLKSGEILDKKTMKFVQSHSNLRKSTENETGKKSSSFP